MFKDLLSRKIPAMQFQFERFHSSQMKQKNLLERIDAVIAEIKAIDRSELKLVDQLWKKLRSRPAIFVVSPHVYQLLSKSRPVIAQKAVILLSEVKSLDYFIQLPRLIEDIGQKLSLRNQNERLLKLIRSATESIEVGSRDDNPREHLISGARQSQCGLPIRIAQWSRIKRSLGTFGHVAFMEFLGRTINSAVRNSDRVLHSKEDEFIVFLSNAEPKHVKLCKARIEKSLELIHLSADQRRLKVPFVVQTLERSA